MENGKWPAIGIDLGTTYSCVGIWLEEHERVEIITNELGNRTTPSQVAFTSDHRYIGQAAQNQAFNNPTNTIFDAKRLIGRRFHDATVQDDMKSWPFKVIASSLDPKKKVIASPDTGNGSMPMIVVTYKGEKRQFTPEQISSMVLHKMKMDAEKFLNKPVKNAVVTIPAYFSDSQRSATKDAATIAGLNVLGMINEPTAAALAYRLDNKATTPYKGNNSPGKNILVFDLGGGTFDVSLLTVTNGNFQVRAVNGNTHLGGRDFDNKMVSYFVEEFRRKHNKDLSGNHRALGRLRDACERAKRTLSSKFEAPIEIDNLFEDIDFYSKITRARFEKLNMNLFKDCIARVKRCLEDGRLVTRDIDDVVLVGGSVRIPKVQQLLQELFPEKKISCESVNPDEAVAQGAALHAAILVGVYKDDKAKNREVPVLKDVIPWSLGIRFDNGDMSVVLPRNSTIPTKVWKTGYTTAHDNQPSVEFKVYEGESRNADENTFLGSFVLRGIPRAPKNVHRFEVLFNIDADGILTVLAQHVATNNKGQITITKHNTGRLSKEAIEKLSLEEAELFRAEYDERMIKVSEAKGKLDDYVNYINDIFKGSQKKLGASDDRKIKRAVNQISNWLAKSSSNHMPFDHAQFKKRMRELERICDPIVAKILQEAGGDDQGDNEKLFVLVIGAMLFILLLSCLAHV